MDPSFGPPRDVSWDGLVQLDHWTGCYLVVFFGEFEMISGWCDRSRASQDLHGSSLSQYSSERVHCNIADVLPCFAHGWPQKHIISTNTQKLHRCTAPGNERLEAENGWNFSQSPTRGAGFLRRERQFYPTGSPLTMGNLDCKLGQRLWSIHHGYWYW